jgi:hypothetical protein
MHECRFNLTNAILAIAAIIVGLIFIGCSVTLAASDQNLIIGEVWAMGGIDPALYSYNLNNFLVAEGLTSISLNSRSFHALLNPGRRSTMTPGASI